MADVYFKGGKIQISKECFEYARNIKTTHDEIIKEIQALKENRKMDSDYNAICKVIVESWLIDNEDSFKEEFERLKFE